MSASGSQAVIKPGPNIFPPIATEPKITAGNSQAAEEWQIWNIQFWDSPYLPPHPKTRVLIMQLKCEKKKERGLLVQPCLVNLRIQGRAGSGLTTLVNEKL